MEDSRGGLKRRKIQERRFKKIFKRKISRRKI
jgi:hypothetical protein